jgi:hypothetical protein
MRILLEEYKTAQKSGYIMKLMPAIIAFILPACVGVLVKAVNLFGASRGAIIISALGDFISFMVPTLITTNYSISKYSRFIALPIRAKSIISFIYIQIYVILIASSLISGVINTIGFGVGYFFAELLKLSFLLLLSNLIIPFIISPQMDITANENNSRIVLLIILIIIGFCSGITGAFSITGKINLYIGTIFFIRIAFVVSIIFFITAFATVRWSFNKSANKVRLVVE